MKKNWDYFLGLFLLTLYLFKNAFSIKLFQDDYFFMQITKISDLNGFLNFFNPIREYSYKPLPTEIFYFIFQILGNNFFVAHTIVFFTYFVGLIYLYKIVKKVSGSEIWAKVTTLLYGISFVHVFQLYWLATYQEVLMFTLLVTSFYKYLNNKIPQALFLFVLALFCKETAILYSFFLMGWEVLNNKRYKYLIPFIFSAVVFYFVYRYSLQSVTSNANYVMDFRNIKLFINNSIWYMLWALGLPNFLYLYMPSLTSKPIPEFWNLLENADIRNYFLFLIIYYVLFFGGILKLVCHPRECGDPGSRLRSNNNTPGFPIRSGMTKTLVFCLIGFYLFLGPILFFMHKWMVRLTMPLVFVSLFQGWVIAKLFELQTKSGHKIGIFLVNFILIFYLVFNYFGALVHESSSLYSSETKIYENIEKVLNNNFQYLKQNKYIYIKGILSERMKNNFHDQSYVQYFLNTKNIKTLYEVDGKSIPHNALVIESTDLLK